jgi:hypothetical protein
MADQAKIGTDWSDEELDLIVADYFSMLRAEQAGAPYVKARHREELMPRIGRTKRSVEFKHMNISAVLRELGLPWIEGYKPKENYQRSIFPAIERFLGRNPATLDYLPAQPAGLADSVTPFIEPPPTLARREVARPEALERLVRKFDPVERDFRNRVLGHAGEAMIFDFERKRLTDSDRPDLSRKVRWVSQEDGDGAGYDILSFDASGDERLIEVKTTLGGNTTPFFITRNELGLSSERPDAFRLYRLYSFAKSPRLFELAPPLEAAVRLDPLAYSASFR